MARNPNAYAFAKRQFYRASLALAATPATSTRRLFRALIALVALDPRDLPETVRNHYESLMAMIGRNNCGIDIMSDELEAAVEAMNDTGIQRAVALLQDAAAALECDGRAGCEQALPTARPYA